MPQAPDYMQPAQPAPSNSTQLGYGSQVHPFWKALEGVVNGLRGAQLSSNTPVWGMHEPTVMAGAGVQQGLQGANQVMADPRNAWMGMGPAAGMALMGRGIRGAAQRVIPEMGGYRVATGDMRQALDIPRPNLRMGEVPGGNEQALRMGYVDNAEGINKLGSMLSDPTHPNFGAAKQLFDMLPSDHKRLVADTMQNNLELQQAVLKAQQGLGGGAPRPLGYGQ